MSPFRIDMIRREQQDEDQQEDQEVPSSAAFLRRAVSTDQLVSPTNEAQRSSGTRKITRLLHIIDDVLSLLDQDDDCTGITMEDENEQC
jgi:hypothetical protein